MDPSIKKIINNGGFIAELAKLIDGPDAAELAKTADAYRNILSWLGITASLDGFKGCEQAQLLIRWIGDGTEDVNLMRKWTAEIRAAINDLAHGKLPQA